MTQGLCKAIIRLTDGGRWEVFVGVPGVTRYPEYTWPAELIERPTMGQVAWALRGLGYQVTDPGAPWLRHRDGGESYWSQWVRPLPADPSPAVPLAHLIYDATADTISPVQGSNGRSETFLQESAGAPATVGEGLQISDLQQICPDERKPGDGPGVSRSGGTPGVRDV